jgi:hydrogenase/urease accessory protein HupE
LKPLRLVAVLSCAVFAALALVGGARAHDARPLSVEVTEQGPDLYLARLRVPPSVAADNQPMLLWPSGCRVLSDRQGEGGVAPSRTTAAACKGGLRGQTLRVRYPIYNPALSTLFRFVAPGGKTVTRVFTPDQLAWPVPREPGLLDVAAGYLKLGIEHIWTGIDHLLFVTGLLILAGSMRRVLLAITGFTVAHSITLSLSALDVVRLPGPPVEAAIALSILFLAREIARPSDGVAARYPVLVSSSFGLLHGFGFAAALREAGLPQGEIATGLLCFNLGVEIGQVVFIAGVVGLFLAGRWAARALHLRLALPQGRLTELAGYGLGVPAAFWFIQRLALLA